MSPFPPSSLSLEIPRGEGGTEREKETSSPDFQREREKKRGKQREGMPPLGVKEEEEGSVSPFFSPSHHLLHMSTAEEEGATHKLPLFTNKKVANWPYIKRRRRKGRGGERAFSLGRREGGGSGQTSFFLSQGKGEGETAFVSSRHRTVTPLFLPKRSNEEMSFHAFFYLCLLLFLTMCVYT